MSLETQMVAALTAHMRGGKPRPPEAGIPLWNAFNELSATRTYHSVGPNPISYLEIEAWRQLTRTPLEPHHVAIIRAMDSAWMAYVSAVANDPKAAERLAPKPALTAAALDAMLG